MKELLKELGIKVTELSQYMRMSRPTLYKYLEAYDGGDSSVIPEKVLKFFKYLDRHKSITKEQVIAMAIFTFGDSDPSDRLGYVRTYLLRAGKDNPKVELMYWLVSSKELDDLVPYLNSSMRILSEGIDTDAQLYQVARLMEFREKVTTNVPLTEEEKEHVRKIMEENE